jgi:hypothetical protein
MTYQTDPHQPRPDPLDELVTSLLGCGAVLSQMIAHMAEFEASGKGVPDAVPIPEMAHSLVRGAMGSGPKRRSKRDVRIAAQIVEEVTDRICEEIYLVSPEFIEDAQSGA